MRYIKETQEMIHEFEKAGLGKAPFSFIGVFSYPPRSLQAANPSAYEAAMKATVKPKLTNNEPVTFCAFCGHDITVSYIIKSSDGKTFVVGCDCVEKTDDKGLISKVRLKKNQMILAARHDKEKFEFEELKGLLNNKDNQNYFSSLPHPKGFSGLTYMDYVDWMYKHCGASGRGKLLKVLKDILSKCK